MNLKKTLRAFKLYLAPFVLLTVQSCQTFEGKYTNPNETRLLDSKWNDSDARQTSEALVSSMLEKPWLSIYQKANQNRPIIIVGEIENRTGEHIDTKMISISIRNQLINSGRVRFLNASNRGDISKEINYQNESGMVDRVHAQKPGKQLGAEFILSGYISSKEHTHPEIDFKTVYYQTDLTLTNLETSEIEFSEQFRIKKVFENSAFF